MSVVGDFTVPAEAFALAHALSAAPDVVLEADRLASHSPREVFPFLWATGEDVEAFFRALDDDPTVTSASVADETDEEVLYRLEWSDSVLDLVHQIVDHHAAILDASVEGGRWYFRLRFADEKQMSAFQTYFRDRDYDFDVVQIYHPTEPRQRAFGLTAEQHEALVTAVDAGYFAVPREVSTEALSDELGISANAVSERIRRGCDTLVRTSLFTTDTLE